jgi:hypothetical protein
LEEFEKKKLEVKNELTTTRSRIYISFNLWTSPNSLGLITVVAHYLNKDLNARSYLIGLRRINGAHSGENIAEAILPILQEMGIISRLGFFIADNAGNNNTYIRAICQSLDIKNSKTRRVRCLNHIINLAAKAFLFNKDIDAFKLTINNARERSHLKVLRKSWRKKEPIGKFYNTIKYIRITPQRREEFKRLLKDDIPKNVAGKLYIARAKAANRGI